MSGSRGRGSSFLFALVVAGVALTGCGAALTADRAARRVFPVPTWAPCTFTGQEGELRGMASDADLIVRGRVTDQSLQELPGRPWHATRTVFEVEEVVKGWDAAPVDDLVTIITTGGLKGRLLARDGEYVLFLKTLVDGKTFGVLAGSRGRFVVDQGHVHRRCVEYGTGRERAAVGNGENQSLAAFRREIRAALLPG